MKRSIIAAIAISTFGLIFNGCDLQLGGWSNTGGSGTANCNGNACADIAITPENPGNTIRNKGSKTVIVTIQWAYGLSCMGNSDVRLGAGQSQTFLNGGYCMPYTANYDAAGSPPPHASPEPARISDLTITPSTTPAGGSVVFRVVLEKPAPTAGAVVAFSSITNTGLTSTIVNMPVSMKLNPGIKEGSLTVKTQRMTQEVTDIVFTAATSINNKSAELIIH